MERKYFKSVDEAIEALNDIKNIDYSSLDGVDELSEREFYNSLMKNLMGTKKLKFTENDRKKYKEALKKKGVLTYREWKDRQSNPSEKMTWRDSVERGSLDAPVNIFSHILQSDDEKKFEYIRDVVNNEEKSDIGKMWVEKNSKIINEENKIEQVTSKVIAHTQKIIDNKKSVNVPEEIPYAKVKEQEQIVNATIVETEQKMAKEVEKILEENHTSKIHEKIEEVENKAITPYKKPGLFKRIKTYGAIVAASVLTLFGAGKKIGEYADKIDTEKGKSKSESEVDTKSMQEEEAAIREKMFDREKWFNDSLQRLMTRSLLEEDEEKVKETKVVEQASEMYMQTPNANVEITTEANEKALEEVKKAIEEKEEAEEAQKIAAEKEIEIILEEDIVKDNSDEKERKSENETKAENEKSDTVIVGVENDGSTTVVEPNVSVENNESPENNNSQEDTREKIEIEIDFGDEFGIENVDIEQPENIEQSDSSENLEMGENNSGIDIELEGEQENIEQSDASGNLEMEENNSGIDVELEDEHEHEHEEHHENDGCDECHRCEEHKGLDEEEIGECLECDFCEEHKINVYGNYESLTFEEERGFSDELDLDEQLVTDELEEKNIEDDDFVL